MRTHARTSNSNGSMTKCSDTQQRAFSSPRNTSMHPTTKIWILDLPNLEVIKAIQSLTSKGLAKTQFSWQWYYYVLTPEGVEIPPAYVV
jgi:Plectin/S10 domain